MLLLSSKIKKLTNIVKAYKKADAKRVEDKRILVDFERARTMLNFKPMR